MTTATHPARKFGMRFALCIGEAKGAEHTLRISIQQTATAVEMRLEGRVAGPWADELDRVWVETATQLASRKLTVDLRNVTYADARGKQVLSAIWSQTGATLLTSTPWTQFLAAEVASTRAKEVEGEAKNADNA